MITLQINDATVQANSGDSVLQAARKADVYIPTLCYHPDLPPRKGGIPVEAVYQGTTRIKNSEQFHELQSGCGLCVVQIAEESELKPACLTPAAQGMNVVTDSTVIKSWRQEKLASILANHPHACLTCAQHEGCPRTQCSSNVPENERCCPQLGNCELQKVAEYVGIAPSTPKWAPSDLPVLDQEPLFNRNYNLCVGCTRCVRACRNLRGIEAIGFVVDGFGNVQVGSVAPTLKESGCKFCTACVEVCPTGAVMDKGVRPAEREKDLLPCVGACPAGINIPWYLRFIAEGKAEQAYSVIRERVPFPGILGRVCVRPCESACRRGQVNESISICALKRFAADNSPADPDLPPTTSPETGKKVAIVGAGPAGLSVAFHLRRKGHKPTIFDSAEKPGGMMRYGIPRYRLPETVLDREIGSILASGVEFRPGTAIGKDISLRKLRDDYEAVYLATGAPLSRRIPVEGANLPQVLWGVDFLRNVNQGKAVKLDGHVVVIGGGAVAVDVALTARRVGAEQVSLVCLEDRHEMPAHSWEIEEAEEEGVEIHNCWGPMEISNQAGNVGGICFTRCVCVFDAQGKFNPYFDNNCTMTLEANTIVMAIGQSSDLDFAVPEGLKIENGLIKTDEKTFETNLRGVYAGGDAVIFPGAIIHAVAQARKAALAIDRYLGGDGVIDDALVDLPELKPWVGRDEGFAFLGKQTTRKLSSSDRKDFKEVDLGFTAEAAMNEAKRCLQCDLRLNMGQIQLPPGHIQPFTEEAVDRVPETEGAFRLMNSDKVPVVIKGGSNMRELLLEYLDSNEEAIYFDYQEDKMFSKRESELVQQHLQKYGQMPSSGSDEDDLF